MSKINVGRAPMQRNKQLHVTRSVANGNAIHLTSCTLRNRTLSDPCRNTSPRLLCARRSFSAEVSSTHRLSRSLRNSMTMSSSPFLLRCLFLLVRLSLSGVIPATSISFAITFDNRRGIVSSDPFEVSSRELHTSASPMLVDPSLFAHLQFSSALLARLEL